ncbi:hypothetical protein [Plantactinospora sp. GCM10030261]|uniref:hypothetical protein n=1 Tax=Plantactinospora sp. GCM10030261 TaxID=3273420 RepID=UPI00361BB50B
MDLASLDEAIQVVDGDVILTATTLPGPALEQELAAYTAGEPIIIANAQKIVATTTVTVTGTATFLNVTGALTTAVFTPTADTATMTLRLVMPPDWSLGVSFPDLPGFSTREGDLWSILDLLRLTEAALILSTTPGADPLTGTPLFSGLNVVGSVRPTGISGLLETVLPRDGSLRLYGLHCPATTGQKVPDLGFQQSPFDPDVTGPVPGLRLRMPIDVAAVSLGSASLSRPELRIYAPPSEAFVAEHPAYRPLIQLCGTFGLPTAEIEAQLTGTLLPGAPMVALSADITGATLSKLEHLAGLGPDDPLGDKLPADVQTLVSKTGGLSLTGAGLIFKEKLSPDAVELLTVTVGVPGPGWTVFPGLDVQVSRVDFQVPEPFAGASPEVAALVSGTLKIAGIPLDVITELPTLGLRAELPAEATIPLADLFRRHLPMLPKPPDLTIDELQLWVDPGESWSLSASMADDPGWRLDLGAGAGLTVSDVRLDVAKAKDADATGTFRGSLVFDDGLELSLEYDLPGEFQMYGQLPDISMSRLVGLLDGLGMAVPHGFDPKLSRASVLVDVDRTDQRLTVAAHVDGLGDAAFTARRQADGSGVTGGSGVAIGIDLAVPTASSLSGLGALASIEALVGLENVMVVLSSLEQPGFQFPDMSRFATSSGTSTGVALPAAVPGLSRGLNIYARLTAARSQAVRALASYLDVELDGSLSVSIGVSLPDPAIDSKLVVGVETTIDTVTSVRGEVGVLLQEGSAGAFLDAVVSTRIQGQQVTFCVAASVLANGVLISGSMRGSITYDVITVTDLALLIGLDWEGIPSLGFAGIIDTTGLDGSVAIFLDAENPAKSLLAGSISDISLADVARILAGEATIPDALAATLRRVALKGISAFTMPASRTAALVNRDLNAIAAAFTQYGGIGLPTANEQILLVRHASGCRWHLTDLSTMTHYALTHRDDGIDVELDAQLYIAPEDVVIGGPTGGLRFPAGMHVDGEIDLLALSARVRVQPCAQGLAADADLTPITLADGDLISITDAAGTGGPRLSLSTYAQPNRTDGRTDPHFTISGRLRLLGLDIADGWLDVGPAGLGFSVGTQVTPMVHLSMRGSVTGPKDLGCSGTATVGLRTALDLGPLGRLVIDDQAGGTVTVRMVSGVAVATFAGSLVLMGTTIDIPSFALPISGDTFRRLDTLLTDELAILVRDTLSDADRWLDWVHRGLLRGVGDADRIATVLRQQFGQLADQAAGLLRRSGYRVEDVCHALRIAFDQTSRTAYQTLTRVGYAVDEAADAIASTFELGINQLATELRFAGVPLSTVMGLLAGTSAEIGHALVVAGFSPRDVAAAFASTLGWSGNQVARMLADAGVHAEQVAATLRDIFGYSADQAANVLKNMLGQVGDALHDALRAAGYAAGEVLSALESVGEEIEHDLDPRNW